MEDKSRQRVLLEENFYEAVQESQLRSGCLRSLIISLAGSFLLAIILVGAVSEPNVGGVSTAYAAQQQSENEMAVAVALIAGVISFFVIGYLTWGINKVRFSRKRVLGEIDSPKWAKELSVAMEMTKKQLEAEKLAEEARDSLR